MLITSNGSEHHVYRDLDDCENSVRSGKLLDSQTLHDDYAHENHYPGMKPSNNTGHHHCTQ